MNSFFSQVEYEIISGIDSQAIKAIYQKICRRKKDFLLNDMENIFQYFRLPNLHIMRIEYH